MQFDISSNGFVTKTPWLPACLLALCGTASEAQTLETQLRNLLAQGSDGFCSQLVNDSFYVLNPSTNTRLPTNFGRQLASLCQRPPPPPVCQTPPCAFPPPPTGGGTGGAQTGIAGAVPSSIGQADQFAKKRRLKSVEGQAPNTPSGGGAGDDAELALSPKINIFFNSDYRELDRRQTVFEPGYHSNQKGFNLGADLMPADWLVTGLAFSYSHWRGDQLSGGGFETDSYGPTVFASLFPWPGFFADLSFQYTRKEGANNDRRDYAREDNTRFGGAVAGNPTVDQYEGNLATGYDYSIGGLTIGPRATARYRRVGRNGYIEQGNSGLELRFLEDQFTSVQTSIGAQASYAVSTSWGVLVPQLNADWTHEYANDQRLIFVQFAQDNRAVPTTFGFQTDRPDRDFFHLGTGVVAVLPNGWQAFANFDTLLGHAYFDNYVGTVGFRLGL